MLPYVGNYQGDEHTQHEVDPYEVRYVFEQLLS
ncbi:hypothetical protein HG1285_03273 [Hydrogenivirga sp. 128-5-R1-1]|nr:hypothetical protein HG1285_03273 [Hydrogenivirga sp. 128-5-R1-1]